MSYHVVIGGGFSGLYTAWCLSQKGENVRIFEAHSWGGMIQTKMTAYGLVESAANGFLSSFNLYTLGQQLGLQMIRPRAAAKARYLRGAHGFKRWPLSFSESLELFFRYLRSRVTGALAPRPQETVFDWGLRCLGKTASEKILRPGVQGIYACPAEDLSAILVLGRFFAAHRVPKRHAPIRGLVSFAQGMSELTEALGHSLQKDPKVELHLQPVTSFQVQQWSRDPEVKKIWIAVEAPNAARLVQDSHPKLSHLLAQVQGLPVISVTGFFATASEPGQDHRGFGFLNHPDFGEDVLGVLYNSQIFENRGDKRSETWILRGAGSHGLLQRDDSEIQAYVLRQRQALFPTAGRALHFEIQRWPWGLPHYSLGLAQIQGEFQKDWDKVRLVGNYVKGIGLTQIADHIWSQVNS